MERLIVTDTRALRITNASTSECLLIIRSIVIMMRKVLTAAVGASNTPTNQMDLGRGQEAPASWPSRPGRWDIAMKLQKACIGVLAMACVAAASACGSSSTSANNSGSPSAKASNATLDSSGVTTAKAAVAAATTEPMNIPATTPLPHAPKKGIKVAFLTCSAAACSLLNPGFTAAAKALGWSPTVITYNSATPGQAVQQAIDAGYKYIATTSITLSTITPQVQEAKAKGVELFGAYTGDSPGGAKNGLYGVAQNGAGDVKTGALMADWIIANSDGHANAVYVDISLYPSLVAQGQGAAAEFSKLCPSCSFATLPVSINQLGSGQVPSAIVSYLQSHPSVNYLYLSFQDLDAGVAAALRTAEPDEQGQDRWYRGTGDAAAMRWSAARRRCGRSCPSPT